MKKILEDAVANSKLPKPPKTGKPTFTLAAIAPPTTVADLITTSQAAIVTLPFYDNRVFGVVDRSAYCDATPNLDIVEMDKDSENAKNFTWASSCAGWNPLTICPSKVQAEIFMSPYEKGAN